jgi:hypothetical protein
MIRTLGRLLALAIAAVAVGLALAPTALAGSAHGHGWEHHCGSQSQRGAGWFNVRSYNVGCHNARRLARRYTFGGPGDPPNWRCREKPIGETEEVRVDCTRNDRGQHEHVRFIVGA